MKRLLVVGGSGLLGGNWVQSAKDTNEVHYTYNANFTHFPNATGHSLDVLGQNLEKTLNRIAPEIIVNCAALADVEKCEIDRNLSKSLNIDVARRLAQWTVNNRSKLVHFSTDQLFDGSEQYYTEFDRTKPLNRYAEDKILSEEQVQSLDPNAIIVRTTFFGWGLTHRQSYSDFILRQLLGNEEIELSDVTYFSPLYVEDLITIVESLINADAKGIFHIGGERISKYQFGLKIARAFKLSETLIKTKSSYKGKEVAKRPLDMSLKSLRLSDMGISTPLSVDDAIGKLVNHKNRRNALTEASSLVPYGRHYVDEKDIQQVVNTIRWGNLTQGSKVEELEKAICDLVGAKYAVAVSSATSGLHLCYKAIGLGKDDNLVTSPTTFVSTANAALFCSADVTFADIETHSLNISPISLEKSLKFSKKTKIISNVLFAGTADGAENIFKIASKWGISVVEDAAHALGGNYSCGAAIGSCKYSDCTVFSLHPVKSIAAGEGGIITTNDRDMYARLKRLRSHGINKELDAFVFEERSTEANLNAPWYYEMQELGYNYRLTDIQCSLAISQLEKLPDFMERRRELVHNYQKGLQDIKFIEPAQIVDNFKSANHIFPVRIDYERIGKSRSKIMHALRSKNIIAQVHYIPVPLHPYFAKLGYNMDELPNAMHYYEGALSIPLYFGLTDEKQSFVLENLSELLSG